MGLFEFQNYAKKDETEIYSIFAFSSEWGARLQ